MTKNPNIQNNLKKLKKMRIIATGLFFMMLIIYIVFKQFDKTSYLCSCIVAFCEAAMIGALADWFAVVALFRYPLGQKWIPHGAIIPNNKDRIGGSIADFVVMNFFTDDIIKSKLDNIEITDEFINLLSKNKGVVTDKVVASFTGILTYIFEDLKLESYTKSIICKKLDQEKLYPLLGKFIEIFVESGHHRPIIKELLINIHKYIEDNKLGTLKFLESLNKTLALPVIGDLVYRNILKNLLKQVDSIENNSDSDINKLLTYSLPSLVNNLKTSESLIEKGEKLKREIIKSELCNDFLETILGELKNSMIMYGENSENDLRAKVGAFIDFTMTKAIEMADIKEKLDSLLKKMIVKVIIKYKFEIRNLIYDTISNWEAEDMANKLEVQVGADLQYIRINGTVIGGLAGLAIHLITTLF